MTRDEFFALLAETPRTWCVTAGDNVRDGECGYCPIIAVALFLDKNTWPVSNIQARQIGEFLGLSIHDIVTIVDAADNVIDINHVPDRDEIVAVRTQLFAACGLILL